MTRSETKRTLARLRKEAAQCIASAEWEAAERLLLEHARVDQEGDLEILPLWRTLEEGRGTRAELVNRVAAFVAAHPELATHPLVRLERGVALRICGEMGSAREELLAARDELEGGDDARALSLVESEVGQTYLMPLDAKRARRAFEKSRDVAGRAGLIDRVAAADVNLGYVELQAGEMERAARAYRAALRGYERAGDERGVHLASYNLGNCLHELGRDRAARRYLLQAREIATRRGDLWFVGWATLILGDLERKAGRLESAEEHYDAVEKTFVEVGGPSKAERAWIVARRAEIALERGDHALAGRIAKSVLTDGTESTPHLYAELLVAIARARTRATGRVADELERVAHKAESVGVTELAWRARTVAARTRVELGVERLLEGYTPRPGDANTMLARGDVARARALLEGSMGSMRHHGRRLFLRDPVRGADARWLLGAAMLAGVKDDAISSSSPMATTSTARATWLRLLGRVGDVAIAEAPRDVLARVLDTLLELTSAGRGWIWIDGSAPHEALHAGRDLDGRELPARPPPPVATAPGEGDPRRIRHRGELVGQLVLEDIRDGAILDEDRGELIDALTSVGCVFVEAARARVELARRTVSRETEAKDLAIELARAEAALGDARIKLERDGREQPITARGGMIGRSRPMLDLFARLDRLRRTELPVLVTGESGTGKELVARVIHEESRRGRRPFFAINCGALAESLLETELFGHVRGAFTGATRDAPGLFLVADGGTLLLDEVGEMSLGMQAKLLRVLQEGELRPVGGGATRRIDVRIVAATNRDLEELVRRGVFREDLFYRLHVLTVHTPPLRVRGDDILVLARDVLARVAPKKRFAPDAAAWLLAQSWSGNVRELRATIEAAAVLTDEDLIGKGAFAPPKRASGAHASEKSAVPERLADLEAWAIERAISRENGSFARAARSLGIGRATLYRKVADYGISRAMVKSER